MTIMEAEYVDELLTEIILGELTYSTPDELGELLRCGRNYLPYVVCQLWDCGIIPRPWLATMVPEAWCAAEFPLCQLDRDEWRRLFACTGYTVDGRRRARPRKPARLFRGALPEHADGWSWTTERKVADWFARRPGQSGRVYVAMIEPERMLAKIGGGERFRNEAEVVVDTEGLTTITLAD